MAVDPILLSAIVTALGAAARGFGKSKQPQTTQVPRFGEEDQAAFGQLRDLGLQGLQDPSAGFEPIAQEARSKFRTETAPGIAERFAGLGATRSSAFPAALSGAGQDLESSLAAQKAQFGMQNRNSLAGLLQLGLSPKFESIFQPGGLGALQGIGNQLIGGGLGGLTSAIGSQGQDQRQASVIEAFQAEQEKARAHQQFQQTQQQFRQPPQQQQFRQPLGQQSSFGNIFGNMFGGF